MQDPKRDSNIYTTYHQPNEYSQGNEVPPYKVFQRAMESQQTLLRSSIDQRVPWKPGFFLKFPYLAILALLGGLACKVRSLVCTHPVELITSSRYCDGNLCVKKQ